MANDLQTIDPNRRTPCTVLRSDYPELEKLVVDLSPYVQRVVTPAERASLASLVEGFEASLIPAPQEAIKRAIGMLSVAFPAQRVSDEEAELRIKIYVQGLADVPADLLSAACRDAVKTSRFFPTVKEIRERCEALFVRQWKLMRIKHLIAKHDREWREPEPEEPMTPEEQARVNAWLSAKGIAA